VKLAILLLYVAMVLRREPKKREKPARFFEGLLVFQKQLGGSGGLDTLNLQRNRHVTQRQSQTTK
jgi:hypothetical protein